MIDTHSVRFGTTRKVRDMLVNGKRPESKLEEEEKEKKKVIIIIIIQCKIKMDPGESE